MSKGNGERSTNERNVKGQGREGRSERESRTSRSSVRMTAERARAIQAHADRTGRNQEFKSRAMAAAAHNEDGDEKATPENQ